MSKCKFAETLAQLRELKCVTQEEVAKGVAVSNKTVSKWETGASMPDLPMLVQLSEYFGVSTDVLLGLSEAKKKTTREEVCSSFEGLDRRRSVLKAFETVRSLIPAMYTAVSACNDDNNDKGSVYPVETNHLYRSQIMIPEFYNFIASSENGNVAVMMLRNKSDFIWLKDKSKQAKMVKLFRFLSDEDTLSVLYYIHSVACSDSFTAEHIALNTNIRTERVCDILDEFCRVGACHSITAHLAEGEKKVYGCMGDGIILSLLSLAYEKMCGAEHYEFNYNGRCKMIGGD